MKTLAQVISWLALVVTLAPALLFFSSILSLDQAQGWMVAGTTLWFVTAPFWMEHKAN